MRGVLSVRSALAPLLVILVLMSAVPTAEAQEPGAPRYTISIEAQYDPSPIRPLLEDRAVPFEVTIRCESPGVDPTLTPTKVRFDLRSDSPWAVVHTGRSEALLTVDPRDCLDGTEHIYLVPASIMVTKDAPAYSTANIRFSATLDDGTTTTQEIIAKAGFYGNWQARFEQSIVKGAPWDVVEVPLVIDNHGNAAIQVRAVVNEESSKALLVAVPPPQTVQSVIAGGETGQVTVPVEVRLPDDAPRIDQLILDITGTAADDTSERLYALQVTAVFHTDGSDGDPEMPVGELPGPGAIFLPLIGAMLAVAARRRV